MSADSQPACSAFPGRRTVTVTGTGEAMGQPDLLVVTLTLASSAQNAADALKQNLANESELAQALINEGIQATQVQTQQLNLQPDWDHQTNRVIGHTARQDLRISLADINALPRVLKRAAAIGGNGLSVGATELVISQPEPLLSQARALAVSQARSRADELAHAVGARVGEVLSITDLCTGHGVIGGHEAIGVYRTSMASGAAFHNPIQPGEHTLSVRVALTCELV